MRPDIPTILIACVCAIGGYLVFTVGYVDDENLGIYFIELPLTDEIEYYDIDKGSHGGYEMTRTFEKNREILTIQNKIDEPLKITVYENGQLDKDTVLDFPARNDERQINLMDIMIKELLLTIVGITGVIFLKHQKNQKEKKNVEE